jgi:GH15 family glucan-1,4-alpha-glucosidase
VTERLQFIPYPPIEKHGTIGDRRTAAVIAADGTLDWLCLPDYNGKSVFSSLLDVERGGFWRMGPAIPISGRQRYAGNAAVLVTSWATLSGDLELTDLMPWPQNDRSPDQESQRVVLRCLRCTRGEVTSMLELRPRYAFDTAPIVATIDGGLTLTLGEQQLGFWSSRPVTTDEDGAYAPFQLREGDEVWAALMLGESPAAWSVERGRDLLQETIMYWHNWLSGINYTGLREREVRRSALAVHLLSYAPKGSMVAAPTTSLPERIGGDRNYDYRFSWVRDASLSLSILSLLGKEEEPERYMDWLLDLGSSTNAPFQIAYGISGNEDLQEDTRTDLLGYRGSKPVAFGNSAYQQRQFSSLGYLADCIEDYFRAGGTWKDTYWSMLRRIADYTAAHWQEPDSGIWELPGAEHYVSSKVMSWVVLDRAMRIAEETGHADAERWRPTREAIHAEVMDRGWSEQLQAFRQRYDAESLDASTLLIPVMGFLPADHPRVCATVDRIAESLTIDGFVHRFRASGTPTKTTLPFGEFEGAFLPCTFWLATTYAMLGRTAEAEAILAQAEAIAGELGLFAEEVDARFRTFLGNTPLLFSQVEYVRAIRTIAKWKKS